MEGGADAIESLRDGSFRLPVTLRDCLNGSSGFVAPVHELPLIFRKLFEATAESGDPVLGIEGAFFLSLGEIIENVLVEDELLPALFAAMIEDVKVGRSAGPGREIGSLLKVFRLAPERHVGLLQNVLRPGMIVAQGHDVAEDRALGAGQQFDEFLGVALHNWKDTTQRSRISRILFPGWILVEKVLFGRIQCFGFDLVIDRIVS